MTSKVNDDILEASNANHITNFKIPISIINNLKKKSITELFEIQSKSFNIIYTGNDFIGRARTGQGKTLAFVLPVVSKIINSRVKDASLYCCKQNSPLVLVLCPVRELASQVSEVFEKTCGNKISVCTIYGGDSYVRQQNDLRRGVDVVIGTCGRVKDLLEKNYLVLDNVKFIILDEVDEMLNIGFADDVEQILGRIKSKEKQVLLFSATLPPWVGNIARKYLRPNYKQIDLVGETKLQTSHTIKHFAICTHFSERDAVLSSYLEANMTENESVIVFADRKKDCNELAQGALSNSKNQCRVLHGDIPQRERTATIEAFRNGDFKVLVATDVAARGLNIPRVSFVVQLNPPKDHETYVHRSGRTGRAGAEGRCLLFYTPKLSGLVESIEKKAKICFLRVGPPSLGDLLNRAIEKVKNTTLELSPKIKKLLQPKIKEVLKEMEPKDTLMALLVFLFGENKFINRSLLCGSSGLVTICIHCEIETNRQKLWKVCGETLGLQVARTIKNMTMFKDGKGAAFDFEESSIKVISEMTGPVYSNELRSMVSFTVASTLPLLNSFSLNAERNGYDTFSSQTNRFRGGGNRAYLNGSQGGRRGENGIVRKKVGDRNAKRGRQNDWWNETKKNGGGARWRKDGNIGGGGKENIKKGKWKF